MKSETLMKQLVKICTKYGYIRPIGSATAECSLAHYDYGPSGAALRQNILSEWLSVTVTNQNNVFCVESSLYPQLMNMYNFEGRTKSEKRIEEESQPTHSAVTKSTFSHYLSILKTFNQSLPFGIAQHGLCLSSRNNQTQKENKFLYNSEYSYQMSVQYYVPPKSEIQWMDRLQRQRLSWWRKFAGRPSHLTSTDMKSDGTGQQMSVQYDFPWGPEPIETIQNLGDQLLREAEASTEKGHQAKFGKKMVLPSVIECRCSLEVGTLVYLLDAYQNRNPHVVTGGEKREVLQLHACLAPYKVAVMLPSASEREAELKEVLDYLCKELRAAGHMVLSVHDTKSSLQWRFKKLDYMGIPVAVILTENSLATGISLLRYRDTSTQDQVHLTKIVEKVTRFVTSV